MPELGRPRATIYFEQTPPDSGAAGVSRRTVTLVNGHTRSSSDFRIMARRLASAGIEVITLDNRGAGRTTAEIPYSVEEFRDDVIGVWDHLGIATSEIVGISMGGLIAQQVAAHAPTRVTRLVLVSTAADRRWIGGGDQSWVTDAVGIDRKMRSYFAPAFVKRNELLVQSMVKQTLKAVSEGDFALRADAQRDAIKRFPAPDLSRITAPTLVVHGDEDGIVVPDGGRDLASRIPGARLLLIPGGGHLLLAEKPAELLAAIIDQ